MENLIKKKIVGKCLQKALGKILSKNPEVELSAILMRKKKTNELSVVNQRAKLAACLDMIQDQTTEFVIVEIYLAQTVNDVEVILPAQACPWYGCIDCTGPECDEECPPGECS